MQWSEEACNGFGSFDQARGSRRGIQSIINRLPPKHPVRGAGARCGCACSDGPYPWRVGWSVSCDELFPNLFCSVTKEHPCDRWMRMSCFELSPTGSSKNCQKPGPRRLVPGCVAPGWTLMHAPCGRGFTKGHGSRLEARRWSVPRGRRAHAAGLDV